jgi:hypothetical protein
MFPGQKKTPATVNRQLARDSISAQSELRAQLPTRICENELNSPNTFKSHNTTAMTTTPFRIDLIVPCIGMNRLISQSITPTTINTITTFISGMRLRPPYSANCSEQFHT